VTNRLVELALDAGIHRCVNVVHGSEEVVNALCDHPEHPSRLICRSTKVGTHVYRRATQAGNVPQCMLGARITRWYFRCQQGADTQISSDAFGAAAKRCMAASTAVLVGERIGDSRSGAQSQGAALNAGTKGVRT